MRKGLVITLGVALVLSVVPAFSEAPIISCIPDIIISDLDLSQQTVDSNVWVFADALDVDEFVADADTADDLLRWSFIETGTSAIRINGIASLDPATEDVKNPGAKNIRGTDGVIDLENVAMTAASTTMNNTIDVFVSDGDKVDSQTVSVTTVNVDANATSQSQDDALVSKVLKSWNFDSGEQGWVYSSFGSVPNFINEPAHAATGGALTLTENASHGGLIIYGAYETPKAPTEAVRPPYGCVMRATYTMKSSGAASAVATPGWRLHAVTKHVAFAGGQWVPDFRNLDFIDEGYVQYSTLNFVQQVRVPSATGTDLVLLYYPNQVAETLLSTSTITYFTFELLDTEAGGNDGGTLALDSLVVDSIDNPDRTVGTEVPGLTTTNFTTADWEANPATLLNIPGGGTPNISGLTFGVSGTDLAITVAPGNQFFEAFINTKTGVRLNPGNYYRVIWELTATITGTFVEPRVRLVAVSDYFIWVAVKEQQGGAAVAGLTQDPQDWTMWFVAPSADPRTAGATDTEPIKLRFGTWASTAIEFPNTTQVGGTVRALSLTTHEFQAIP